VVRDPHRGGLRRMCRNNTRLLQASGSDIGASRASSTSTKSARSAWTRTRRSRATSRARACSGLLKILNGGQRSAGRKHTRTRFADRRLSSSSAAALCRPG
jgi:hypothetical protein